MALSCFPDVSKRTELKDGTCYGYAYIQASTSKPTFLLLHGFPSSSYDWRHQLHALAAKGFGVFAPDLLGYGDTDSPTNVEAYDLKKMSDDLAEIMAQEGIVKAIGVGHDWGSGLLSCFYIWHAECLMGLVFISVGYIAPSDTGLDIDAINALTKQLFGYETYGYWKLLDTENAAKLLESHHIVQSQSTTSLFYPMVPETWKSDLGPLGAAEAWISSNKITARPAWLAPEESAKHDEIFAKKGYNGPLNWYKHEMRGLGSTQYTALPEERKHIQLPTLLVVSTKDYITRADMQKTSTAPWVKTLKIEELDCGHWIQLERPKELNELLKGFAEEFDVK